MSTYPVFGVRMSSSQRDNWAEWTRVEEGSGNCPKSTFSNPLHCLWLFIGPSQPTPTRN